MEDLEAHPTVKPVDMIADAIMDCSNRGGIIVIDDPIRPEEAMSETARRRVINWYANTLSSRLNDKSRGAILLVMQRLHEEDLAGHLLEAGGWEHLSLPAIVEYDERVPLGGGRVHKRGSGEALHSDSETKTRLNELKAVMGAATFSAQYQQSPMPAEGLHVKAEWFRRYDRAPDKVPGDLIVQSWDTATKDGVFNDYSVCITALLRKQQVFILDVFRRKLQFPDLRRQVIGLARNRRADALLIEDVASGAQLIQIPRHERPLRRSDPHRPQTGGRQGNPVCGPNTPHRSRRSGPSPKRPLVGRF